jgi:hypothetical protein
VHLNLRDLVLNFVVFQKKKELVPRKALLLLLSLASSICTAARHAGILTSNGQIITIIPGNASSVCGANECIHIFEFFRFNEIFLGLLIAFVALNKFTWRA